MPIHEYKCSKGHVTEQLLLSFPEAERVKHKPITCTVCGREAELQEFSVPQPGHFYGNPDGYYKPSPTKRFSTKLVSQKEGNKSSIG